MTMTDSFYSDDGRISYPEADRIVTEYIDERAGQKPRTTSRRVLEWADLPDNLHNQRRIHDALSRFCVPLDTDWAGRTVFQLPTDN